MVSLCVRLATSAIHFLFCFTINNTSHVWSESTAVVVNAFQGVGLGTVGYILSYFCCASVLYTACPHFLKGHMRCIPRCRSLEETSVCERGIHSTRVYTSISLLEGCVCLSMKCATYLDDASRRKWRCISMSLLHYMFMFMFFYLTAAAAVEIPRCSCCTRVCQRHRPKAKFIVVIDGGQVYHCKDCPTIVPITTVVSSPKTRSQR